MPPTQGTSGKGGTGRPYRTSTFVSVVFVDRADSRPAPREVSVLRPTLTSLPL